MLGPSTFNSFFLVPKRERSYLTGTFNQISTTNFFKNKQMEERNMENRIPNPAAVNRYKFLWRVFLIGNFALGAYMFAQAGKKEKVKEKREAPAEVPSIPAPVTSPTSEESVSTQPIPSPVIVRQPIPEDQQRELFKWMLDEKRKLRPSSREEKLQIDEEKAILKDFLRSKSIPSI